MSNTKLTNPKDTVGVRKAPLSVVPANVIAEIGVGMMEGALKYGRHNYREAGARASVYYDAAMRHLMAWWEGEDIDADSGMSHITKLLTCMTVLRDAQMQGMCEDDRPPKSVAFYQQLNNIADKIIDKYKDKQVKHVTANNKSVLLDLNSDDTVESRPSRSDWTPIDIQRQGGCHE